MPLREWNINVGQDKVAVTKNTSGTAVSGGATNLGGTIGMRLLIDDAVTGMSKQEALRQLEVLSQRVIEDTWPPA